MLYVAANSIRIFCVKKRREMFEIKWHPSHFKNVVYIDHQMNEIVYWPFYWHSKIEKYENRKSSFLSREMSISQKIKSHLRIFCFEGHGMIESKWWQVISKCCIIAALRMNEIVSAAAIAQDREAIFIDRGCRFE